MQLQQIKPRQKQFRFFFLINIQIINNTGTYNETYYYDSRDLVAKKNNDGEISYYHPDHLGSTSLVTNSTGSIVENTFYLPYGSILSGGSDRYDYEGKETDSTDLQYFGARYYDSYTRVFTQPDSIIPDVYDPQQLNPYMFERGNPYTYQDKEGHDFGIITGIVLTAFVIYAVSWVSTLFETGSAEQAYESATAVGVGAAVGVATTSIVGPGGGLGVPSVASKFIGGVAGIKTVSEVTGEGTTKTQELIAGVTSVISSQVGQYFETQGASELIESIIEPKIEKRLNQIVDLLKPEESLIINNNANYKIEEEEMTTL